MKKKVLGIVLATVLVLSLGLVFASPVGAHTESEPYSTDLLAGQHTDVGDVEVWNDGVNLHVTYLITEPDWVITGTHLYVGQNNPNELTTAPGQFPYDDGYATSVTDIMVEYVIPLDDICAYMMELNKKGKPTGKMIIDEDVTCGVEPCDDVYIAAHAGVDLIEEGYTVSDCLLSGVGTDSVLYLLEGTAGYPVGYPGPYAGTPIPSVLAWVHPVWPAFPVAGAQWIDSSNPTANTDNNTWRLFTRSFSFPSNATNISGTLTMNCDNAQEVYLNTTLVGYDTNHPSTKIYGVPVPPSGPAHGWQTIESWDVSTILTAGTNDLWTMTRNYAWGGGPYANPGGLIYSLCYEYDIPDTVIATETAWGDGTDFDHPNWAMYFSYHVQPQILVVAQPAHPTTPQWEDERDLVLEYLNDLGFGYVTSMTEPTGGLTSTDLDGYDVVIFLAWSYPPGYNYTSTVQTLIDYFDGGGRLIVCGDDSSRVESGGSHPYQTPHPTYNAAFGAMGSWEAITRLDYSNNGGSNEIGILDGYTIVIEDIDHPVVNGVVDDIRGDTFPYYGDPDTTNFWADGTDATSLATAARVSASPYPPPDPPLTGGTAITAYESGAGKIVTIGLQFYNGYYHPTLDPDTTPEIPSAIAEALLGNSIDWVLDD
ncbi:hypothetical protein ACFLVY_00615 [Chloroflexota bacterium]